VTIPGIQLAADDAMELTELLGLLIDWIDSDHTHLPASLRRFIGSDAYDAAALRTDLARFQFLLGGAEQPYFGTTDPDA
jgi:hypothetical protein